MKIAKIISIIATEKEIQTIGNFIALFDEMDEGILHEVNKNMGGRLENALDVITELYDTLEEDYND